MPERTQGAVAIPAQYAEAFRVPVLSEPGGNVAVPKFLSMGHTATVNVVNGEKLRTAFAAASTLATVVLNRFHAIASPHLSAVEGSSVPVFFVPLRGAGDCFHSICEIMFPVHRFLIHTSIVL